MTDSQQNPSMANNRVYHSALRTHGTGESLSRSGRSPVHRSRKHYAVLPITLVNRGITLPTIKKLVSHGTIRAFADSEHLHKRVKRSTPFIYQSSRAKRIAWAEEN